MARKRVTFNVDDLRTAERLERVLRQFESALMEPPAQPPPPSTTLLARQLEPSIRDLISQSIAIQDFHGEGVIIVDTHFVKDNLTPAAAYDQGAAFYETDREVIFVNEIVGAAHRWRYFAGEYPSTIANIPDDLGSPGDGFIFYDTEVGVQHRWRTTEWESRLLGAAGYSDDDADAAILSLVRAGGTVFAPTALLDDYLIAELRWKGQVSTTAGNLKTGAIDDAIAAGDWTTGGGGVVGAWSKLGDANSDFGAAIDYVNDSIKIGEDRYVAVGNLVSGGAEVWRLRAGVWAQVGGDSVNGSWATSVAFNSAQCLATDGTNLYVGIGDKNGTNAGAEVWKLEPDTTWTKIGDHSFGWPLGNSYVMANTLLWYDDVLYAGLQAFGGSNGKFMRYDGTPGSWTELADTSSLPNNGDGTSVNSVSSALAVGSTMYIGTGGISGGNESARTYSATIGTWSWTLFGGAGGINSSWDGGTQRTVPQMAYDTLRDILYVLIQPTSADQVEVWAWNLTAWDQIGGDNLNAGWNSNVASAALRTDGGIALDSAYVYAGLSASATEQGVYRRLLTGGDWEHIAGDGQNGSWDSTIANSVMRLRVFDTNLYAGIGDNNGEAEFWTVLTAADSNPADRRFWTTDEDDTDPTLTAILYGNKDIALGTTNPSSDESDLFGIFYQFSTGRVSIMKSTRDPSRTLDVAGDDGWHLNPSTQPGSPAAGDQIIHSAASPENWMEWYDGTVWRFAVSGPSSAVDGDIALFNGVTGRILRARSAVLVVKEAGGWIPITNGDPDDPQLLFDSNGELLVGFDPALA